MQLAGFWLVILGSCLLALGSGCWLVESHFLQTVSKSSTTIRHLTDSAWLRLSRPHVSKSHHCLPCGSFTEVYFSVGPTFTQPPSTILKRRYGIPPSHLCHESGRPTKRLSDRPVNRPIDRLSERLGIPWCTHRCIYIHHLYMHIYALFGIWLKRLKAFASLTRLLRSHNLICGVVAGSQILCNSLSQLVLPPSSA